MFYLLVILSTILRIIGINQSLWLDESIQALALQGYYGNIFQYALSDFQPPLYHLVVGGWVKIAGYSEVALRLPSIVLGVMTVIIIFKIAENFSTQRTAFIAGLLAATNPLLIYYSQEGRTYAMTTFLISATFFFLVRYHRTSNKYFIFWYSLFLSLTLWTSYLSWSVLVIFSVYYIYKKNWPVVTATLIAGSTLIIWLPSLISSLKIGMGDAAMIPEWGRVVGGTSLKSLILTWVKWTIGRISFANKELYALIVFAMASLHVYILRKIFNSWRTLPNIVFIWFSILPLAASVSLFVPAYSYTRVLFVLPAFLLLMSLGLTKMPLRWTYTIAAINLIFIAFFWLNPRFHREDWRNLTKEFNKDLNSEVVMPSLKQNPGLLYYGLSRPLQTSTGKVSATTVYYIRYVEELYDSFRTGPANLLAQGYIKTDEIAYTGIMVEKYQKVNDENNY